MKQPRRIQIRRGEEGSTLIETMIALVLLSTGLLAVGQMIPAGLIGITEARTRTIAVQAAQQRLETIRSSDFDSATLTAGTYTEAAGRYTIAWTIVDDTPVPDSKRVDITASWDTVRGTRAATLTTYVTQR